VRKADNLPPSCAVVMKSGNLNFLKPSGPLQACNGTDLPLHVSLRGVTLTYEQLPDGDFQVSKHAEVLEK